MTTKDLPPCRSTAITRIHVEVTDAPPDLVHVIYVGDGKIVMQTAFFIGHWSTAQPSTPSPSMSIRPTCS